MKQQNAFSLVELSIVLVIIGLLVGGILAGKSLIRASELRSVSTDFQRFKTAALTFRNKYLYLPGDLPNATSFWATGTGNGNGNGLIGGYSSMSGNAEAYRAWQQLGFAGLVEGDYTGVAGASPYIVPGTNVPASRISNGGYNMVGLGNNPDVASGNAWLMAADYGNAVILGRPSCSVYHCLGISYVITPEEAWNIDIKLDDGMPGMGAILTPINGVTFCASSIVPASSTYVLSNKNTHCALIFKLGI